MSLKYVLGEASSGKTTYMAEDIVSHVGTEKNLIYIVPEQCTLEAEALLIKSLVHAECGTHASHALHASRGALMQIQVLSFNRLSHYIFSEVGWDKLRRMDSVGKSMLIRKIALDLQKEFSYYKKASDKYGFIEEVSDMITELYQYNISRTLLEDFSAKPQIPQSLSDKLSDIAMIYQNFQEYLEREQITADDCLTAMAQIMDKSGYLKNTMVWIDSFTGFTPQEEEVIAHILYLSDEVTISMPSDKEGIGFRTDSSDLFYESKSTVNRITELAEKMNMPILPPVFIKPRLEQTAMYYFRTRYPRDNFEAIEPEGIYVSREKNIYEETEKLASVIIRLVRDKGYKYHDIGIAVTDIELYARIAGGIFKQYGIPLFIDRREKAYNHPLIELLCAVGEIVCRSWSYEGVFRFLKSGLTDVTPDRIFDLENYCLAYGIKGQKKWHLERWEYGTTNPVFNLEEINGAKAEIVRILDPVMVKGSNTVDFFSKRIFEVLDNINITEKLTAVIEEADREGEQHLKRRHKQVWDGICNMFDKMSEMMGSYKMSFKVYCKIMEAGLISIELGLIPPTKDQVMMGDIERSRFSDIKALLVAGFNEGSLTVSETSLINEEERKILNDYGMRLKPDYIHRLVRQELYIYSVLSKPRELLHISCPTGTLEGKTLYPLPIMEKISRMGSDKSFVPPDFVGTRESMLKQVGGLMNSEKEGEHLLNYYSSDKDYKPVYNVMKGLSQGKGTQERLMPGSINKLYGNEIITNVSKLERYVQCPFAYFLRYNLNAYERPVYKVDYVDIGNLFHDLLEEFARQIEVYGIKWTELDNHRIEEFVEKAIEAMSEKKREMVALNEYMIRQIKRIGKRSIWALVSHMKAGDFETEGVEMDFRSEVITGIEVSAGPAGPAGATGATGNAGEAGENRRFILTGRIDRVDVADLKGNRYIKIIDYKTGNKKLSPEDIYFGTQLQLMLYMNQFINATGQVPERLPGGVFYFHIDDPIIDESAISLTAESTEAEILEKVDKKILSSFKMSGLVLADPDVIRAIDKEAGTSSQVVSGIKIGKDGIPSGSAAVTSDEFQTLQGYANQKVLDIGNEILEGKIDVSPLRRDKITPCRYCGYSSVCKIDLVPENKKYRQAKKFKSKDAVIEACLSEGKE